MERAIRTKITNILSQPNSSCFILWTFIRKKLTVTGAPKKLLKKAFIFVFIDIKQYPNYFESISLRPDCVDEQLAPLLLILFTCIKKITPRQDIGRQHAIYFSNITTLLKTLSWSTLLCEKLTKLDNEFLVELLESDPCNKKIAKAIPDAFLLKRVKNCTNFIKENTAVLQKIISTTDTQATQSISCTSHLPLQSLVRMVKML
jgi:hypothetical protein